MIILNLTGSMDGSIGRIEVKKGFLKTHCDAHPFDLKEVNMEVGEKVDYQEIVTLCSFRHRNYFRWRNSKNCT